MLGYEGQLHEEVGLYIEGATRAELNRGYMLSKPDTIIGYSKVTVTIRVRTKGEGGQNTPIQTGIKPNVAFADTYGEVIGEVTFPEGTTFGYWNFGAVDGDPAFRPIFRIVFTPAREFPAQ